MDEEQRGAAVPFRFVLFLLGLDGFKTRSDLLTMTEALSQVSRRRKKSGGRLKRQKGGEISGKRLVRV